MPKPIVQIRQARIVPALSIWPWRTDLDPEAMVMLGQLASVHPTLGEPVGHGGDHIRSSLIVEQRLSAREVETMNTIYQLVD